MRYLLSRVQVACERKSEWWVSSVNADGVEMRLWGILPYESIGELARDSWVTFFS